MHVSGVMWLGSTGGLGCALMCYAVWHVRLVGTARCCNNCGKEPAVVICVVCSRMHSLLSPPHFRFPTPHHRP